MKFRGTEFYMDGCLGEYAPLPEAVLARVHRTVDRINALFLPAARGVGRYRIENLRQDTGGIYFTITQGAGGKNIEVAFPLRSAWGFVELMAFIGGLPLASPSPGTEAMDIAYGSFWCGFEGVVAYLGGVAFRV